MALPLDLLRRLEGKPASEAWKAIADHAWDIFDDSLDPINPIKDLIRRDKAIGDVDLFLATAGWDLWEAFGTAVTRTSSALVQWWAEREGGCAVLILDALSLREAPWIIEGLQARDYIVHEMGVTGAELPADTTPFAKALGFGSRSSLYNNGAGGAHKLTGARTEALDCAFADAAAQITPDPRWVLWHAWPDSQVHQHAEHGRGLQELAKDAEHQLTSDGFWKLIEKLTQGRRLVITADHGYAATGLFPDIADDDQVKHMKDRFKAGRSTPDDGSDSLWVPPIDLVLDSPHGRHRYVVGRRKWRVAGGHPTLAHGGLSVLEVLVPFIDISRAES